MKAACIDTSFLVAITFREPGWQKLRTLLRPYDALFAGELLAAEFLAAARRECLAADRARAPLEAIRWVLPDRSLRPEIDRVLAFEYLRGADLYHLALALYLAPSPAELPFLTRDARQGAVAARLGFPTP